MGKKKSSGGENNNNGGDNKKKEVAIIEVVLKLDMHCDGCVTRIKKSVSTIPGVEAVKVGDGNVTKLTVIGKVDPSKLREAVEKKAKKKVELISPVPPKKENNNSNKENNSGNKQGGGGENNSNKKADDKKKPKEPPVTTAVIKLNLHCQGCIQKIRKIVTKTKGYLDMSIDEGKEQITVKGAIDMNVLVKSLSEKLKKKVEIVPPKKEGENKEKGKDSNGGKGKGGDNNGAADQLMFYAQYGYPNMPVYGYGYPGYYPAPQMFSDENPNACSVM